MSVPSIKKEGMCRTCLSEESIMISVFDTVDNTDSNTNNQSSIISEMLMSCTSLQVLEGDGLPDQVCLQCVHYITKAFSFKQLCEQSDATLRQLLKEPIATSYTKPLVTDDNLKAMFSVIEQKPTEFIDVGRERMENDDILDPLIAVNDFVNENAVLQIEEKTIIHTLEVKKETTKEIQADSGQVTYPCKKCSACFTSSIDFKVHSRTHPKSAHYICQICNKSFRFAHNLNRHKPVHDSAKCHLCSKCGKIFIRKDYFDRHMRSHNGERPHVCKLCGKALAAPYALIEHMRAHANEKNFVCSICGKGFARRAGIVAHRKTHEGIKTHACKVCGKRLSGSNSLKLHMKIHTGLRDHVCSHCGKGFTTRGNLVTHERMHTGERPYTCDICGKGFHNTSNLTAHSQSHSDKKQYVCSICKCDCSSLSQLKKHKCVQTKVKS
ncbi:hypothetical protein ILUMI_01847 [Ignelater luminosus]|uniref:Uncharacterized protein n=1 Tax=Ignelater luminosus TaxID=2038154 RepID=A0A8K0GLC2_IGNLU|nr:hypothetical protein ILUMI_01847 [Ignelater luminosus]